MGPKKAKEANIDENFWQTLIERAIINEQNFSVKVIIIEAAGSEQDRLYLNKFETCAAEERRFVIKNICKTETIFMINQLGGEKKVKDDSLIVFEVGQSFLKEKKDIPPEILALIIKHLILKLKDEYLFVRSQRLAVEKGIRKESATMVNRAEVRGTVSVNPPENLEPPPPPPKEKAKKGEVVLMPEVTQPDPNKKYNTSLRVRGEEWRDKIYVDDFPTDGPNLYVAITGFLQPSLASCLLNIGIPLRAVVQVRIDPTAVTVPSSLFRASKRGQSQTEILGEKCFKFWDEMQQIRVSRDSEILKQTAFIIFSPPYWNIDNLSGNPEKIYDEICYLLYDLQDLTRQHNHYINNMDIINIPEEQKQNCNLQFYKHIIREIPLESTTLYSVMDSMLQTVSKNLQGNQTTSSCLSAVFPNPSEESKEIKVEKFVNEVFKSLCQSENQKKEYRVTYGEEYEQHKDPLVINHGDISKYNTFHIGNMNLKNLVWSMLYGMPVNKLWHNIDNSITGELEAKINFHVNVLLSCFERSDVETSELYRLIHILACRKLYNNRSSLKKQHLQQSTIAEFKKKFLKRSVLAEPLPKCPSPYRTYSSNSHSIPCIEKSAEISNLTYRSEDGEVNRIRFLFDCPDISELVSAAEIANDQPVNHIIDDFEYFEDFSEVRTFQVMFEAFNDFNCVDYKYCEVTDTIVLMFYNSHDKDGISRNDWRCHMVTPVCLQDFFDFILEEHYDWIQNEEKMYDENNVIRSRTLSKDFKSYFDARSCIENTDVEADLLLEGSLKHQELTEIEEAVSDVTGSKISTFKKTNTTLSVDNLDSKSTKKTKSSTSTPKNLTKSFIISQQKSEMNVPKKPFTGYDLGDRRVEVFGRDSIFFSKDGSRVYTFYTLMIPMSLEYINLNVFPGDGNISFWMHRAISDNIKTDIIDTCESFRISTQDGLNIYVKKQNYEIPIVTTSGFAAKENIVHQSSVTVSAILNKTAETAFFHSLIVTWPNGLITETVYENHSSVLSHMKQFYTTATGWMDEDMRCISLKGEVIIFKKNGDIEVLRPDGSIIKITKYGKRVVSNIPPEIESDVGSDKTKKKGKEKNKPVKPAASSPKNVITEDIQPLEYELFIEEFETIETDGLRQKWVLDDFCVIEKLLIRTATDYILGEIFSRRMDGTHILLNKDGVQVVTFPNNTRIITKFIVDENEIYPEWTEEEMACFARYGSETDTIKSKVSTKSCNDTNSADSSDESKKLEEETTPKERTDGYISVHITYTIEHSNFTTITINKATGQIHVDSPNKTTITVDANNSYDFKLDEVTDANFDGATLNIFYEACTECKSSTKYKVEIIPDTELNKDNKIRNTWLKMKDSFNKNIIVDNEGTISLIDESSFDEVVNSEESVQAKEILDQPDDKQDTKSDVSTLPIAKCVKYYDARTLKFFILKRELSCSELVHRVLIDDYKKECRWQPWCSISQYDTFGDHRTLLSILTPVHLTESEKWLMDSTLADKPKYLTYKDLKPDTGKGFYHWMRPYERFEPKPIKPANVLPPRLPRAFILRTLEHQWKEDHRVNLRGAKELITAILRYRHLMEADSQTILSIPITDLRPEEERRADEIIQAIAHRVYEDIKTRLADDVEARARPGITSVPPPPSEETSVEVDMEDETTGETEIIEEEGVSLVKEVEEAEEMSPLLRRYWHRRAEEYKEEQFYHYLLREGSVPPYFRNVLGGAIWWEMNNIAGEAATNAERGKMKCVCALEEVPAGE